MTYGKKIGKLVQKYTKGGEQLGMVVSRRSSSSSNSGSGRLSSVSSRSSSPRGSSRRSDNDSWYDVDVVDGGEGEDDDDDDGVDDVAPVDVPEGCLAVYVGPDLRRFVIQASFLSNHVFRELLRRSEEEYGFETEGGLRIPCEAEDFEKLLWQMENEN